jgi:hypothetical protein
MVLLAPPMRSEEEATAVRPVPPYATPMEVVPTMVPLLLVVRTVDGIWKSVVEPVLEIEKSEEVAKEAVELEIWKRVLLKFPAVVVETCMAKAANGDEVPTPTNPAEVMVVVPLCPAAKVLKRPLVPKKFEEVAFASVVFPAKVLAPVKRLESERSVEEAKVQVEVEKV